MTYLPVDVTIDQKAKERHRIDTLNLLAYVSLLVLVLVTTWFFKRRKRLHLHETGLAIIYGLIMGALLRYFGLDVKITSEHLKSTIPMSVPADYVTIETGILGDKNPNQTHFYAYEFRGEIRPSAKLGSQISYASVDPEVFFNIILPPIVLNAGLSLKRRHFFRNIGAIFCYAFIGTTVSVATVGSLIYWPTACILAPSSRPPTPSRCWPSSRSSASTSTCLRWSSARASSTMPSRLCSPTR
jgi:sodium/hydrogen exchanger-like protein 6/7